MGKSLFSFILFYVAAQGFEERGGSTQVMSDAYNPQTSPHFLPRTQHGDPDIKDANVLGEKVFRWSDTESIVIGIGENGPYENFPIRNFPDNIYHS